MMAHEMFESTSVSYMLNTARMPFFVLGSYPHYAVEADRLVRDTSETSRDLRREANETYDLIKRIQSRQSRGMRIPKTWTRAVDAQSSLVTVLRDQGTITEEWAVEFHRMVRWLRMQVG
jgi:hypothetical protein